MGKKNSPKMKQWGADFQLLASFDADLVYKHIKSGCFVYDGYKINVTRSKMKHFKEQRTCVYCGVVGNKFLLQRDIRGNQPAFLSLYRVQGKKQTLMTMDHIMPLSKGGPNNMSNIQTLCWYCNQKKADKLPEELKDKKKYKEVKPNIGKFRQEKRLIGCKLEARYREYLPHYTRRATIDPADLIVTYPEVIDNNITSVNLNWWEKFMLMLAWFKFWR